MPGPLSGVRVLDLSRILSGPFGTMLLADLGADVVKVERPGRGDPARTLGPMVDDQAAYFMSVNRGKRSIAIDLSQQEGRRLVRDLVPHFDVLVENFVPGAMARWGIDFESLRGVNPRLIYASISGFGQTGPDAQRPALDIVVQAMGGMMSVTGAPDGPPLRPGASLGDSVAGLFATLGIVTALYQRDRTGEGQHIDLSMLDCQATMMENAFARYFATGVVPGRMGSRHPEAVPFQAFATADRYIVVALLTDDRDTWRRFCEALTRPDLADDERYSDNRGRVLHADVLIRELDAAFGQATAGEWIDRLTGAGIPCGPVNDIAEAAESPLIGHREMIRSIPHASRGHWRVANTPFRFSKAETGPVAPAPSLGEHTDDVLRSLLGLDEGALSELRSTGAIS
jgi:CoA:oxalate CoA-transferase